MQAVCRTCCFRCAAVLLAAACVGVVAGAMLQAATGFGFSLAAAPLLFAAIGPEPAVVLLLVLGLRVDVLTLATERRRPRPLRHSTIAILAWSLPVSLLARRGRAARVAERGAAGRGHARRGRHAGGAPGAVGARAGVGGGDRGGGADDVDVDERAADAAASARPRRDARAGARTRSRRASSGSPRSVRSRCSGPAILNSHRPHW